MFGKISCIMPVYNCEKYLEDMVDSVISQSYPNFELILVDDGSKDRSGSICDEYAERDKRIRVFHKDNGGVSSARNYGLEFACGDYCIFLDSDDLMSPYMLELLVTDIVQSNSDVAICGYAQCQENDKSALISRPSKNYDLVTVPKEHIYDTIMMPLWNKLIRKDIIGFLRFEEGISYGEDLLFSALLLLKCKDISIRKDVLYLYIKHSNSLSWQKGNRQFWIGYIKSKELLYEKLVASDVSAPIVQKAYNGLCIAILALYRFAVHDRDEALYRESERKYRDKIFSFIKVANIGLVKKLEYLTFVYSYNIACLFHKKH